MHLLAHNECASGAGRSLAATGEGIQDGRVIPYGLGEGTDAVGIQEGEGCLPSSAS